jgi:hypothetical protein
LIPLKEEGPPTPEGPSEEVSASLARLNTPPPATGTEYTPDVAGSKGARWAKVPLQVHQLRSRRLVDVLVSYSGHAMASNRVAVVSDTRIATELEWFYTSKKTGKTHPHRRKVWSYRRQLEALGYLLPAGRRCIEGKWIDAWLVAPFDDGQVELAQKWRLQTYVATSFGAPNSDGLVHPIPSPGAPDLDRLVHPLGGA